MRTALEVIESLLFRISDVIQRVIKKKKKKGLLKHSCSKLFWLNYKSSKVGFYYNGNRVRTNSNSICRQHCIMRIECIAIL